MMHNGCTIEQKIEIGCNGCSVAVVTNDEWKTGMGCSGYFVALIIHDM